ncbi:MBL fold metallo-hydrolase [Lentilactobacillus sp. SPB1-3]|uniref:MBL fold metallo-hydrolase n=1 Tax=Lentilactobacillus terminaliae TaxID=3003483 RepID=A0ACD5DDC1_9LACO|nr:MBL fold metallo-hydrolase [Lentilactobacillus sp. SPB1-3]MCZ0977807.1 MBL fold metallo-hydrolase [Lentilactobacillus sp. SPB1-3]
MKLTVLGYLGGYPSHGDGTSAYLLESNDYKLLIDFGSGALLSLEKVADPLTIDAMILTHYHNDHIADVGVMQYYWQLHNDRPNAKVLPIYGHTADKQHFESLDWPGSTEKRAYDPEKELNIGPYKITFMKTHHPVVAYALRIEESQTGKVLVFTADSAYFGGLISFCQDADLLLTDTNFYADKQGKKWHMTTEETGRLASQANVKRLLLSHLPESDDVERLVTETTDALSDSIQVETASTRVSVEI